MEIAVVGTPEFTLGFQLAGVNRLYHPEDDEALADTCLLYTSDAADE